ncbi:MAG: PAS domain S-box protein [Bacteroidales bacterium]
MKKKESQPGRELSAGSGVRSESEGIYRAMTEVTGEEICQNQKIYTDLVERAPYGIYIVDSGFRIAQMNIVAQNIAFRNVRPVIGREFTEAMHILWPDPVAEEIIAHFRHTLATGEPYYSPPFMKPRHDVSMVESYEWELHRIMLSEGYGVICYYYDSTRLREAENAVQEGEERFRKIVETAGEGIIIASPEGEFQFINNKFAEMLGYSPEEILGKDANEFIYNKEEKAKVQQCRNQLKKGETVQKDMKFRRRNGSILWTLYNATPLFDANGNHNGNLAMHTDITERKQAEEALREREQRLGFHFENSPLAIIEWDADFIVTQWSKEAEHIFGWTKRETLGKRIDSLDMIYSEDLPIVNRTIERLISGKETMVISSNRNVNKFGAIIECTWYNSVLQGENGEMKSVMSLIEDITIRKKAEEALRESERVKSDLLERLNQAQHLAMIGSWDWDLKTDQVWWSDETYRIFGVSPDKYVPGFESSSKFIHPDDFEQYVKAVEHSVKTGDALDFDSRLITPEGILKYCNGRGRVITDGGQPIRIVGTIMDITERTKAEIKLREAKTRLNLALENASIGVWEWDLATNETNWDEKLDKMFGLIPGSFEKTYKELEYLINEEDLSHIRKSIRRSLERDLPFETVFRIRSDHNGPKYISTKALVNKDNDGKPISFTGVCFDVTALREGTEKLVLKLNEELLRSNKELENFAYVASHDLQEPLRMVSSFTQLLEHHYGDKLDDRAKEYIHYSVEGAKRMYDLLNGLLAYSRIHTRGREFNKVDLNRTLDLALKNLALQIEERDAVIKCGTLPSAMADESQMISLFQNLISNSIKFSPEAPRIYVSSEIARDHYIISVRDEGLGIESQYFDRIFQIFQRLLPREQFEGTGIGLAICKRIVERHRGRIWVESEPGKGSTFYFTIPSELEK